MEETIKGIEVIAYKGMNFDMTCKGFQYEIGKTYKTDKAELCNCGFHACLNPIDVLDYYSMKTKSRYFKVKLSGEITKCDSVNTKVAATEMTILEEITDTFNEVIKTEWWKNDNVLDLLYFSDGLARIRNCDKQYNFIDTNGNFLSKKWFNCVDDFCEGFARVEREDRQYNFIDKDGKYLTDEWFKWAEDFREGFARVERKGNLMNFIDTNGKIISNEWFNEVYYFHTDFAKVKRSDKLYNFINKQGKILSDEWFIDACYLDDGLTVVKRANGEWCNIDKSGTLIKILQ